MTIKQSEQSVKIAVVGTGHLGIHHCRVLSNLSNVELIGVVDIDPIVGQKAADLAKVPYYADFNAILDSVEAVDLVTPTNTHHKLGCQLLEAGKHLFVEKPICTTVREAEDLIALSKANRLVLQVGHIERFNPAVMAAAEILKAPRFVESHRLGSFQPRVKDIGVVLDLMIHDLDLILSLVRSPVKHISAVGVPILTEREDIANARLEFASGCIANVTVSRVSAVPMRKIRFFQPKAYISLDYLHKEVNVYYKKDQEDSSQIPQIIKEVKEVKEYDALEKELSSFVQSIREGTPPLVDGEEARKALKLAITITEQIRSRLPEGMK